MDEILVPGAPQPAPVPPTVGPTAAPQQPAAAPQQAPQPSNPVASSVKPEPTLFQRAMGWVMAQAGEGVELPSWSRALVTVGVLALIGVGVAMTGSALTAFLAAGAVSAGIGGFATWLLSLLAWVFVIYYGAALMVKTAKYFLTKHVDADIAYIRDATFHAVTPNPKYTVDSDGNVLTMVRAPRSA